MDLKKTLKSQKAKPVIAIVLCIVVGTVFYLSSYYYNISKIEKSNATVAAKEASKKEEALKDDSVIKFNRKNAQGVEETYFKVTIGELKSKLKLSKLTQSELEKMMEEKGYKKYSAKDDEMIFTREEGTGLLPNKYYLGDKDGNIAMYKTDENGKAFIEKDSDVTVKALYSLPKIDSDKIKGFESVFDTREECEEALSGYTS